MIEASSGDNHRLTQHARGTISQPLTAQKSCREQHRHMLISTGICLSARASAYQYMKAAAGIPRAGSLIPPSLPLKTSNISLVIRCLQIPIHPPRPPTSGVFSMLPWPSTPSKLGQTFVTTHSPTGSIAATAPILFLKYSKNKPRRLTNSGEAIPDCSSGSHLWSMCYMPSLTTQSLVAAQVL